MNSNRLFKKIIYTASFFACIIVGLLITNICAMAVQRQRYYYYGNMSACLSESGRSTYPSVQYACQKASSSRQNACTGWLGSASDDRTISVPAGAISVPVTFYGMCTYDSDTTSEVKVYNDGGSLTGYGNNHLRSSTWGEPAASSFGQINVAKFKNGAVTRIVDGEIVYYREITIERWHSDHGSSDMDVALVFLSENGGEPVPTPEPDPVETICDKWGISLTSSTTEKSGTSLVTLKIRNTESRFADVDWGTGPIYAKPTDNIAWHACYKPGVQTTSDTEISELKVDGGTRWKGYPDLSNWSNTCIGAITPTKQKLNTAMTSNGYSWDNNYNIVNNMDSGHTLVSTPRLGVQSTSGFGTGNTEIRWNHTEGRTNVSDVSRTFTETGTLYQKPKSASIDSYKVNPVYFYAGPGTCKVDNKVKVSGTDYSVCSSNAKYNDSSQPNKGEEYDENGNKTGDCWRDPGDCGTCHTVSNSYQCVTCTNYFTEDVIRASVTQPSDSVNASVKIPYNYENHTTVKMGVSTVDAGEADATVASYTAEVSPRYNSVTRDTYATKSPDVSIKLYAYVVDAGHRGSFFGGIGGGNGCGVINNTKQCAEIETLTRGETLNGSGNLGGDYKSRSLNKTYNAFDASAGDYMCFVTAIFPASSGPDTQMSTGGDGQWRYSAPDCAIIAKKPSFQVWGSGMYSSRGIVSYLEEKKNVYVNGGYKKSGGNTTYFGSWVDQGLVIGNGVTTTVASGAALGNNTNNVKTGNSGNICNWSSLTFANSSCGALGVGKSGIGSGISDNREELINYWLGTNGGTANVGNGGTVDFSGDVGTKINTSTGVKVRYIKSNGDLTISGGSVGASTTYLVKVGGTLTINGNISYNGNYGSLASVPKVVIYANNVNINCSVTEVDAVIVTGSGGSVNTCSDAKIDRSDINEGKRSMQLKIFGTVITDSVELGRTYGNAAWSGRGTNGQKEAAEIFDYDSSILMWSEYMAGAAETDTLQTVYQHELAPRY